MSHPAQQDPENTLPSAEPPAPSEGAPAEPPRRGSTFGWLTAAIVVPAMCFAAALSSLVTATMLGRGPLGALNRPQPSASPSPARSPLAVAAETCNGQPPGVVVGDNGRSLSLDRVAAEKNARTTYVVYDCILSKLDVPDSVLGRLGNTRALDGTQRADWGRYRATWTYHPDDGINMIIEMTG